MLVLALDGLFGEVNDEDDADDAFDVEADDVTTGKVLGMMTCVVLLLGTRIYKGAATLTFLALCPSVSILVVAAMASLCKNSADAAVVVSPRVEGAEADEVRVALLSPKLF